MSGDRAPVTEAELAELERLANYPDPSEDCCARCHNAYSLGDGLEASAMCHACAQEVIGTFLPRLVADLRAARAERDEARNDAERERVRLAGCGVAALGYPTEDVQQGDWAHSASLDDVRRLRARADAAESALALERAEHTACALEGNRRGADLAAEKAEREKFEALHADVYARLGAERVALVAERVAHERTREAMRRILARYDATTDGGMTWACCGTWSGGPHDAACDREAILAALKPAQTPEANDAR